MNDSHANGVQHEIEVNGRTYWRPAKPVVIVCADGLDPAYLDAAFAAGNDGDLAVQPAHRGSFDRREEQNPF